MLKSMTVNKCPEFSPLPTHHFCFRTKQITNYLIPATPMQYTCSWKLQKQPLFSVFHSAFAPHPADTCRMTSPDFYIENWVHLELAPSRPLIPTWLWSWEPTFSSYSSLWLWEKGTPSPLSLQSIPQEFGPSTTLQEGRHPLPTGSTYWVFQPLSQLISKVFNFKKRTWISPQPIKDTGRTLPWDLWVHLFCKLHPSIFVLHFLWFPNV